MFFSRLSQQYTHTEFSAGKRKLDSCCLFHVATVKHELILAQTSLYYIIPSAMRLCGFLFFFMLKCFYNWRG